MLKCASAYTVEVDDPEIALSEIKGQLDKKITLLEHSVGIIMCHPEFVVSGVLEYICENLPFDLAGITTSSQAVNDEAGELILTIFLMTSDDVRFKTGVTESGSEDADEAVKNAYARVAAGMSETPKLALIFPPFPMYGHHSGDAYVRAWEKSIPDTPFFGTCAIDDTTSFEECETIYNGISYRDAMPFVLCYGNINPRFMVATFSQRSAIISKAEITKAAGNVVYEINHMNARQYFKDLELIESVNFFTPFMIDLLKREDYDGVSVIRGYISFTEDGAVVFSGDVDEGSTFAMLTYDPDDILPSTCQKLEEINKLPEVNGALLFPCIVRRAVLLGSGKPLSELQNARGTINPYIPFMMGYAGGEICPTSVKDGVPTNRFHNYSLVVLVV